MDRHIKFRRSCDRFAALRQKFLVILLGICALFAAISDLERYLATYLVSRPATAVVPCPPVYNQEKQSEQLNYVELVC